MNKLDTQLGEPSSSLAGLSQNAGELIGCDVLDAFNRRIGKVKNLWIDRAGRAFFAGVATIWIQVKVLVLPLYGLHVDLEHRTVQFPFPSDNIKEAPAVEPRAPLTGAEQQRAWLAFHLSAPASTLEEHMQGLGETLESAADLREHSRPENQGVDALANSESASSATKTLGS